VVAAVTEARIPRSKTLAALAANYIVKPWELQDQRVKAAEIDGYELIEQALIVHLPAHALVEFGDDIVDVTGTVVQAGPVGIGVEAVLEEGNTKR
jgi:hypothetical protein